MTMAGTNMGKKLFQDVKHSAEGAEFLAYYAEGTEGQKFNDVASLLKEAARRLEEEGGR